MRKRLLVLIVIAAAFAVATAQSDTPQPIQPGDMFVDFIDNTQFEVFYDLKATAGELIIFELVATNDDTELTSPEMVLYDAENNVVADTLRSFGFRGATLAVIMPQTGGYQLIVTRDDGRMGEDQGEYRLQMIQPVELVTDAAVDGTVQNNSLINYYTTKQDGPFSVEYSFAEGDLRPLFNAYRVSENGLALVATLEGSELASGAIGLAPTVQETYVFTVGDSPFAYNAADDIETADYQLSLTIPE